MTELLAANAYFPLTLTLGAYCIGVLVQKKWRSPILNPILLAAVLVCAAILPLNISVTDYKAGCAPLQYLLTPATICYAVSLYEQLGKLRRSLPAILAGIFSGTVVSLLSVRALCMLFGLDRVMTATLLPKSITTAIGMVLSQEAGGAASLTAAVIILTGILGNMFAPLLCRLFRITDEMAMGTAIGTSSHAVGTARAAQISDLAGAVSSLSLTVAGLITVVLYSFILC